jgi:hypothetical protein
MQPIDSRPVSTALKIFAVIASVGLTASAVSPTFAQSGANQAVSYYAFRWCVRASPTRILYRRKKIKKKL